MNNRELIIKALEARKYSYSPYSGFAVGAALLCADGSVYTGCNVENASYGATNCAERTAAFKAVSEGARKFSAIAIVGGRDGKISEYCPPCGICRQVLWEFADGDMRIILFDGENVRSHALSELLPLGFSKENVE
jgi:cytidine deaminase